MLSKFNFCRRMAAQETNTIMLKKYGKGQAVTGWFFFSLEPPLKVQSTTKLIKARLCVSRTIYVNVDSPNQGFAYYNFFMGYPWKKSPCIWPLYLELETAQFKLNWIFIWLLYHLVLCLTWWPDAVKDTSVPRKRLHKKANRSLFWYLSFDWLTCMSTRDYRCRVGLVMSGEFMTTLSC